MIEQEKTALFLMMGQSAERVISRIENIPPSETVLLSQSYDLGPLMPELVRRASTAAETYKLFFIFEGYLRDFVIDTLSKNSSGTWWDKVPKDVQDEVTKLEETEETKSWMALGSRDKAALMTYSQILRVIDHCWKDSFEDIVRDKTLLNEARLISHLRNAICHMTEIPEEDLERVRQTMRDWFRVVAP